VLAMCGLKRGRMSPLARIWRVLRYPVQAEFMPGTKSELESEQIFSKERSHEIPALAPDYRTPASHGV
jgi:hypothetical protein